MKLAFAGARCETVGKGVVSLAFLLRRYVWEGLLAQNHWEFNLLPKFQGIMGFFTSAMSFKADVQVCNLVWERCIGHFAERWV